MRIRSRTLGIAIAGSILAALAGGRTATAAEVGAAGVSVGVAPNTDPDVAAILDCPYATSSHTGHHGGSWDSTTTTQAGTVTLSAPDPNPGGSGLP